MKIKEEAQSPFTDIDPFQERAKEFWSDIDGIVDLLNKTDPKHENTTIHSPQVNQYLFWRILSELKSLKVEQNKIFRELKDKGIEV